MEATMRCRELFAESVAALRDSSDSARLDAARIFEHILGIRAAELPLREALTLPKVGVARVQGLIQRRSLGEPIAYLCGEAWFFGRRFIVDERVLVPRPETELLIEFALTHLRSRTWENPPRVADVGTGSGAIAVTLAVESPGAQLTAIDCSPDALRVAAANRDLHGVGERMRCLRSDLFSGWVSGLRFDLVAANLPYLRDDELPSRPNPLGFEPRLALVGGPDGLRCYRRLLRMLPARLEPGALVLLEAAPPTMARLAHEANAAFPQAELRVISDYGGAERVLWLKLP
jgi:release factor glutamine methyltransferase